MKKIDLQPTMTAQWHALVNEAQHHTQIYLNEDLESYLVFLLIRFSQRPEMAGAILAMEFLESLHLLRRKREIQLRDVGDKCLLFSGLFPGVAQKRQVSDDYFVNMGQSAYSLLADGDEQSARLYNNLSVAFENLITVLRAMRIDTWHSSPTSEMNILDLNQLFADKPTVLN
ncbi:MAG: hypothetical protein KIT27_06500 [Legionellales bacterium]|nr:hypothetical protein [Legionellales bacterium]